MFKAIWNWLIEAQPVVAAPATVDEALSSLNTALAQLAVVREDKAAEAADYKAQAEALNAAAEEASNEASRADAIHGNISTLLAVPAKVA